MRLIDADTFSDEMRNRQNAAYELMQHSEKGSETNIRMDSAYAAFIECALTLDKMPAIDAVPGRAVQGLQVYRSIKPNRRLQCLHTQKGDGLCTG